MNKEALDMLHDSQSVLLHVSDELSFIAGAFDETGNERMAEKLFALSKSVKHARELVHKGTGEALAESTRVTNEATGNMIRAVFAGCALQR